MHKAVHFEIPAEDLPRMKNFYGSVLGWQFTTVPMSVGEYTSVLTTPVDEQTQLPTAPGAINGGTFERTPELSAPVITVDVPDIDEVLRQVESHGGSTVTPRTAIEGMGAFAYFRDTEGNVMGLWETPS